MKVIADRTHERIPVGDPAGFILLDAEISDYEVIYETQRALVQKKKADEQAWDYLIFVEHPEVYTYGRKSKGETSASLPNSFFVERGGEATYHNKGQLVCYPILRLREKERDLALYLRRLEGVLIDLLRDFNIPAERRKNATGVWLKQRQRKIASIGVAVSSWVTFHGCALNVNNDLSGFSRIKPCGFESQVMTSMKEELGTGCPSIDEVKESYLTHFSRYFDRFLIV